MSIIKTFYKESDERWYIDLPEYIEQGLGYKENLEMIAGADTLLDKLSEGDDNIMLKFDDQPFDGYTIHLIRSNQEDYAYEDVDPDVDGGGWYHYFDTPIWYNKLFSNYNMVWLCPATLYVFKGVYPKNIYVKVHS